MRILIFTVFTLIFSLQSHAQTVEIIRFQEKTYEFGDIKEEDGPVDHEFKFVNVSDRPILIAHVKASCGCTTPGWSRDTIPPGGSGYVMARYDPKGRPGAFHKNLTVTSVPIGPPVKLFIKGRVSPKPITIEDELPVQMGDLRSKYRILNVGRIKLVDEPAVKRFPIYNGGKTVMKFKEEVDKPNHIEVSFEPKELPPGTKGSVVLSYNTRMMNDLGFRNENVTFYTYEEGDAARKSFSVYTNVEEYFPPMSQEQLNRAPVLTYDKVEHDFGRVSKNSELKTTFTLTNDGKEAMMIRKVQSNCSCVTTSIAKMELSPGESAELDVVFNTRSRRSNQQKAITVYVNSPTKPISRVIVKAYVETN